MTFGGNIIETYTAIRHAAAPAMGWRTGKGRGWDTAHPGYWLPLDLRRWRKHILLVFDVGRRVKPCVLLRDRVPID